MLIGAAGALLMKLRAPVFKLPLLDGFAHFRHDHLIIMQIVYGVELRTQNLAGAVQMVQTGAAEVLAGIGAAGFINRAGVEPVCGVLDV